MPTPDDRITRRRELQTLINVHESRAHAVALAVTAYDEAPDGPERARAIENLTRQQTYAREAEQRMMDFVDLHGEEL